MKKVEILSLQKLPDNWKVAKIGDLGVIITGTTPSTKVKEYWGKGFPFVTPTDFSNSKYVSRTERSVTQRGIKKARVIPKDSVMVTCIASVGEVSMASEKCITNQQINTIICKEGINPHYIYYIMVFRKKVLKKWAGITTSPIIKKSLFEKFLIPLPPLPEQKKIAEILSTVDEAIEKTDTAIEKTERLKKGLMQKLLTEGWRRKDEEGRMKKEWRMKNEGGREYKETEIGRIPKEWEVVRLEEYIDVYSGYAFKRQNFLNNNTAGVPIIKIGNLQNGSISIDENTSYVSEKFYKALPDFQLHQGDVLIALSGATTGKISVVHKDIGLMLVNQRVGKFKILNATKIYQFFFYYLVQSNIFKRFVIQNIGQSAQGNLSPTQLKKSFIPLPPLPEQKKIAEILSTVDKKLELLRKRKEKYEQIKKGLMNDLLTGRKRVDKSL